MASASLALVVLLLVTGCRVNEHEEMAKYREVLRAKESAASFAATGELDLATALRLANLHNEQLAIAGEDYLQALIDKQRAAALFLPTITLAPSYSQADASDDRGNARGGGDGGGGGVDPDDPSNPDPNTPGRGSANSTGDGNLDVPVNLRYNVFNGYRDVASLRRAARTAAQRRALLLDLQQQVLLDVAQVYYQVLRAEALVEVLENTAELQNARVRDTRARQQAGFAQLLDVARAEAQAAGTRVALIDARNAVWNGRTTLAFLTDAPVADTKLSDRLDVPAELPGAGQLVAEALRQRHDVAAARSAVEAATQGVDVAVGQYYPSVSFNANYFLSRESNPTDSDWNGLISASLPIFTAGVIHANVRTALSRLRQAYFDARFTRRQAEQDVLLARHGIGTSDLRLSELGVQLQAAEDAFRRAQIAQNAGAATYLDLLIAQDALLTAQLDLASARFDRKVSYLNLLRATGRLDAIALADAQ